MKKIIGLLICVLSLSCTREKIPYFEPLRPFTKILSSGLEILILEDHELPTVEMFLYLKGGSVYDPSGKEGLSAIAMQAIRSGGTVSQRPHEVEELLEFTGTSLEMGSSKEFSFASLAVLKKDWGVALDLLFELLQRPALDPGQFAVVKEKAKEGLLREEEDPLQLASREYPPFVYGEEAAWGRRPTLESLEKMTLEDVKWFHKEFLAPDRLIIAAAGDISAEEIIEEIGRRTKEWPPLKRELASLSPLPEHYETGKKIIPRAGLTQSTIIIGHLGAKRDNPDKYPLLVMNFILGGSGALTSRLGEEIRSSAGKAYSVWSDFGFGKDYGLFRAIAQTALENTPWVVAKIGEMIQAMAQDPQFTEAELFRAKQAILHSLFFDFETRFSQVKEQARFRLLGYPEDYLIQFQKKIAKVALKDLRRVAHQYLHPEGLKTLVVTSEELAKQL